MDFFSAELTEQIKDIIISLGVGAIVYGLKFVINILVSKNNLLLAKIKTIDNAELREEVLTVVLAVEQWAIALAKKQANKITSELKYDKAVEWLNEKGIKNVTRADIEAAVAQIKSSI